ncbi:DUF488 domain-containing protein [Salininema proteolyticum]|uniref:DUF488 domain-containing protein n=1 Tax=Salininema proteolyticum TaxID=1607685 RepID=A0ABV8U462_9ACTN
MNEIALERVYDYGGPSGGAVFLVDRLWPRGVSKERLEGVEHLKDIAPSAQLRIWFGHLPDRFDEFSRRYRRELDGHPEIQRPVLDALKDGPVTLLYAAKDPECNHALVLKAWLEEHR